MWITNIYFKNKVWILNENKHNSLTEQKIDPKALNLCSQGQYSPLESTKWKGKISGTGTQNLTRLGWNRKVSDEEIDYIKNLSSLKVIKK